MNYAKNPAKTLLDDASARLFSLILICYVVYAVKLFHLLRCMSQFDKL